MRTDCEILEFLRKYACTGHPGKMGQECVVDKVFLTEVADRFEELAFTRPNNDYKLITHFFKW